jgi:hypothetical protein
MTVRRLRAYTAETGSVYQYYFVGKRPVLSDDPAAPAAEFIFDVSSDRKQTFAVSVLLTNNAVVEWEIAHGRELAEVEQYAAAKMMLFRSFDSIENLMQNGRRLPVEPEELEELLTGLNVD